MPHRVVSLLPAATEIVAALGYRHCLVGRSHECDFPADVQSLPVCTRPLFDVSGSSRAIDEQVRSALRESAALYGVRSDVLEQLRPTLIVGQQQCDVCAIPQEAVEQAVCSLPAPRPALVSLQAQNVSDVFRDIAVVADVLGDPVAGLQLIARLKERMENLAQVLEGVTDLPAVVGIEWMEPLMSAGNLVPDLINMARGTSVLAEPGRHSPWITWDALAAADPDVIAIMPCGFSLDRTIQELALLTDHPAWRGLKAVRANRVFIADGNQYFNRLGPRFVDGAEILAEILHPDRVPPRHQGHGWIPLPVSSSGP